MLDNKLNPDAVRLMQGELESNILNNLQLCIIRKIETATKTETATDYYGYATVQNLHGGQIIRNVLLPQPMAGNSSWCGGFPLENTLCLVGNYSSRRVPVVIAYIPFRYDMLIDKRGTVDDEDGTARTNIEQLDPGEWLIQAARAVVDSSNNKLQIPLGRVKWDKDGRIVITSQRQIVTITIGDMLNDGTSLTNSRTKKNVVYRIACKKADESDSITLDIDTDGNYILENANGDYVQMTSGTVEVDSANIKLGSKATQAIILGNLFMSLYNSHTQVCPLFSTSGPPVVPMSNTQLANKGKVE